MRSSTDSDDKHQPGFMQPLLPNFLTSFSIPKAYVKRMETELKGDSLQTVVLMSQSDPRRHWVVGVQGGRLFTSGWKEFCLHFGFQVGDFVVFEYRSNLLFHVSLFDPVSACQRLSHPSPFLQGSTETTDNHDDAAIPSNDDPLSCFVRLTPYNVKNSIIYLPIGFARENGLQLRNCQVTITDAERNVWPVDMRYKKIDGQVYIKKGWKKFLAAKGFKPGHRLCFQFIRGGTCPTLKCFRANRLGVESSSARQTMPKQTQAQSFTATPSEQDLSHYPCCHVHLSSYAIEKSVIYFPIHFLKGSGLQCRRYEVEVEDEEERRWPASLNFKKTSAYSYLFGGWKNVVAANCFRRGDVISFQLCEAGEIPLLRCYRRSQRKQA